MSKLFDDDELDTGTEIKTNSEYANHYNSWRQKEELNKLKTKYGDISTSNEASSSSEEDDDGGALTEEFEKDFFKTLSCLKKRDPKIYDSKIKFFKGDSDDEGAYMKKTDTKKNKKKDPLFLKDYEKKMVSKMGGKFEDDESEPDEDLRSGSPTYVEEQRIIKESLKQALNEEDNEENKLGGLFQKRMMTNREKKSEEDDYTKWLKGKREELGNKDEENELKPLKEYWNDPKLDRAEVFLRDYLLNKRYLDTPDEEYIPTYEEIVHDSDEGLSEDEEAIETQEEFETKYNFRYEEPDQEYIKRYPRTMDNSVRKTDDRRKLKRIEIKERKEQEKKQMHDELKQLKAFKRKEIEEKIMKLRQITGNKDIAFQDYDLEEDFDPETHDKKMQEVFSDKYYDGEEGDLKPEYPELTEELGPWKDNNGPHCEDDNFNMDCDFEPTIVQREKDKGKKKRNRYDKTGKKKEDQEFDENDERYEQYMDELFKLDYEDMIGDLPCRFKYREVVPNSFGLTIEEILLAKDRDLNRWCSLKKTTQHRPENVEKYEVIAYEKKAQNEQLKRKILSSLYEQLEELQDDEHVKTVKTDSKGKTSNAGENTNKERKSKNIEKPDVINKNKKIKNSESLNKYAVQNIEENETEQNVDKNGNDKEENASVTINESPSKQKKKKKRKQKNSTQNKESTTRENVVSTKLESEVAKEYVDGKLTRRQRKNRNKLKNELKSNDSKEIDETNENKKRKRNNSEATNGESEKIPKKKMKKNKNEKTTNKTVVNEDGVNISNSRLEAYGINPKKYKNKLKFKKTI